MGSLNDWMPSQGAPGAGRPNPPKPGSSESDTEARRVPRAWRAERRRLPLGTEPEAV